LVLRSPNVKSFDLGSSEGLIVEDNGHLVFEITVQAFHKGYVFVFWYSNDWIRSSFIGLGFNFLR
jgi:hypothetical protein